MIFHQSKRTLSFKNYQLQRCPFPFNRHVDYHIYRYCTYLIVFVIITHKLDRKKCFDLKQESKQTKNQAAAAIVLSYCGTVVIFKERKNIWHIGRLLKKSLNCQKNSKIHNTSRNLLTASNAWRSYQLLDSWFWTHYQPCFKLWHMMRKRCQKSGPQGFHGFGASVL